MKHNRIICVSFLSLLIGICLCPAVYAEDQSVADDTTKVFLSISKKTFANGALDELVFESYEYEKVDESSAAYYVQNVVKSDTSYVRIRDCKTNIIFDEDMYIGGNHVRNILYNDNGKKKQVTIYRGSQKRSITHYKNGHPIRKYRLGKINDASFFYPDGKDIYCQYKCSFKPRKEITKSYPDRYAISEVLYDINADVLSSIKYLNHQGEEVRPSKPQCLAGDSLLCIALARIMKNAKSFKQPETLESDVELHIDESGYLLEWRILGKDIFETTVSNASSNLPFVWKPAMVDGMGLSSLDTIRVRQEALKTTSGVRPTLVTVSQLPQTGDEFYSSSTSVHASCRLLPFFEVVDSLYRVQEFGWSLRKGSNSWKAKVTREGDKFKLIWTKNGVKIAEEIYHALDQNTLEIEENTCYSVNGIRYDNYFVDGILTESVRLGENGDTISVWKAKGDLGNYVYVRNINEFIYLSMEDNNEPHIEYRNVAGIKWPQCKQKISVSIPRGLKEFDELVDVRGNWTGKRMVKAHFVFSEMSAVLITWVDPDGSMTEDFQMDMLKWKGFGSFPNGASPNFNQANFKRSHLTNILQYAEPIVRKKLPSSFTPGTVHGEKAKMPMLMEIRLK